MTDKKKLRSRLRQQRTALTQRQVGDASQAVAKQIIQLPSFHRAKRIGLYMANMGELDPRPLLDHALQLGKHCYLPVLHPFHSGRLWFTRWQQGDRLQTNSYGIKEPVPHHSRMIKPYALDLVIMPLLGFDRHGNRLGMGKGYYDRCFSYLLLRRQWRKPELIGIAYAFQEIHGLQAEAWDVPLDRVITECASHGPFR